MWESIKKILSNLWQRLSEWLVERKDGTTNGVAILLVVFGAIKAYSESLNGGEVNWSQLAFIVLTAVIAWFTGKNPKKSS